MFFTKIVFSHLHNRLSLILNKSLLREYRKSIKEGLLSKKRLPNMELLSDALIFVEKLPIFLPDLLYSLPVSLFTQTGKLDST